MDESRNVRCCVPRPIYVKELEPMALPGVWDSKIRPSAVYEEAKLNRELFERGKIDMKSYRRRAAEIVLGRSA